MPTISPGAQDAAQRIIFIILLMFFFTSSPNQPSLPRPGPAGFAASPRDALRAAIARQRRSLDVLNSTHWGEWQYDAAVIQGAGSELNLTGFRNDEGYLWDSVWGDVKTKVGGMRERIWQGKDEASMAVYQNVTGQVLGEWVRSDIGLGGDRVWNTTSGRTINLTTIEPEVAWTWQKWSRNITGHGGSMALVVKERDNEDVNMLVGVEGHEHLVQEIDASLTIEDESHGGEGWEIRLHGVHWPTEGSLVMTTTSDKYAGIFGLPHLTMTEDHFNSSQTILNRTLERAISKREEASWGIPQDPYNSDDDSTVPHCEYVVYAQVHPITVGEIYTSPIGKVAEDLQGDITALERELRLPLGAPVISAPALTMTLVVFSPDCGFVLESKGPPSYTPAEGKHLQGLKQEIYIKRIKHWALIWAVVLLLQVFLLRSQMKEASTPSTISRISVYTAGTMAAADFVILGSLMLLSISAPVTFPTATLTAFAGCLSMGLGVRFLADVYNVQEPERREANRIRAAALAEELAAFRARRDAFLTTYRRQLQEAAAARVAASAAPIITAAGVEVPTTVPATTDDTSERDSATAPAESTTTTIAVPPNPSLDPDEPIIIPADRDLDAEIMERAAAIGGGPVTVAAPNTNATLPITNAQLAEAGRISRGQDLAASYGQFMMALLCFFFLTISSPSWPTILRRIYFNLVGLCYFSFWTPQIWRNAVRNCRKAFQWRFVAGQSLLRILPWAYFYLREDNVLFAQRSVFSIALIGGWLWLQILVLIAMNILGPRFALPKGWLPDAWDYHPLLKEDDVEGGGLPLGLVRTPSSPTLGRRRSSLANIASGKKNDSDIMSVDCAICMQKLDVPVFSKGEDSSKASGVTGLLARRAYMVTPCRHMFHSGCLEGWMKYRLQCPNCRENLPPL